MDYNADSESVSHHGSDGFVSSYSDAQESRNVSGSMLAPTTGSEDSASYPVSDAHDQESRSQAGSTTHPKQPIQSNSSDQEFRDDHGSIGKT